MTSLADAVLSQQHIYNAQQMFGDNPEHAREDIANIGRAVKCAARYRVDRDAMQFVRHISNQMTDKLDQVAQVNMPSGLCFIEMPWSNEHGGNPTRSGFLFIGRLSHAVEEWDEGTLNEALTEATTDQGTLVVVNEAHNGVMSFTSGVVDFPRANNPMFAGQTFFRTDAKTGEQLSEVFGEDGFIDYMDSVGFLLAGFAAALTSPKVVNTVPTNYTRLNKGRVKAGKEPLLEQRDVHLLIPKPEVTRHVSSGRPGDEAPTGTKVRHMVSLFTRMKGGKIEVVSPHWRGDASKGIKLPSYFATGGKK